MKIREKRYYSVLIIVLLYVLVVLSTAFPWFGYYKYIDCATGRSCINDEIYIISFICFGIGIFGKLKKAEYCKIFLCTSGLCFILREISMFFLWDSMNYQQGFFELIGNGYYWYSCFNRTLVGFYLSVFLSIALCIASCKQ